MNYLAQQIMELVIPQDYVPANLMSLVKNVINVLTHFLDGQDVKKGGPTLRARLLQARPFRAKKIQWPFCANNFFNLRQSVPKYYFGGHFVPKVDNLGAISCQK